MIAALTMFPVAGITKEFAAPEVLESIIVYFIRSAEEAKDWCGFSALPADIFSLGITFLDVLGAHPGRRLWEQRPGLEAEVAAHKAYKHGKVHAFPYASLPPASTPHPR